MRTLTVFVAGLFVAVGAVGVTVAPAAAATGDGATLSGLVWLDPDADGQPDDGELGRAGVRVSLRTDGAILDATTSEADGTWTFNEVQPGSYTIVVDPPSDTVITGGTLPGLDPRTGEASVTVEQDDLLDLGVVGLGSPVDDGPDAVATVTLDPEASDGTFVWEAIAHNLGPEAAEGPIDLRMVLSSTHEAVAASGDGWSCDASDAIVLCTSDAPLPAQERLPPVTLTTEPVGDVGERVSVTATVRLEATFDAAPLNDEDAATATIDAASAAEDLDGDGNADLTDTGATVTGLLVAALLALVAGAAALGGRRRTTARP